MKIFLSHKEHAVVTLAANIKGTKVGDYMRSAVIERAKIDAKEMDKIIDSIWIPEFETRIMRAFWNQGVHETQREQWNKKNEINETNEHHEKLKELTTNDSSSVLVLPSWLTHADQWDPHRKQTTAEE